MNIAVHTAVNAVIAAAKASSANPGSMDFAALDGVLRVHDLHVWTLASGSVALSAHMEVRTLDDWPRILAEARELLDAHHGIHHVTLQPEVLMAQPLVQHVRAPS